MKTFQFLFFAFIFLFAVSCEKEPAENSLANNKAEVYLAKAENTSEEAVLREKYFDSARSVISKYKNDSVTRLYYRRSAIGYYMLNKFDKSIKTGKEVFNLAEEANDTLGMAKGLYFSAVSYYGREDNDSAFSYYKASEKLFEDIDDKKMLGEIVLYKAYIYYNVGEYMLCETEAFKALRLLDEDDAVHIYSCYNLIATALEGLNNYEEAIKYYSTAAKHIEGLKKQGYDDNYIKFSRAMSYNNLGVVYLSMKKPKEAAQMFNKGLEFDNLKKYSPLLYARIINNVGYAQFLAKDYSSLPGLYYESLKVRDSLDNDSGVITSNYNIGEYYLSQKDTLRAITHIIKSYRDAEKVKSHADELKALKVLAEIDKKNSSYYSERYIKVNDRMQASTREIKDRFARIAYETDKLQVEKEELAKKNNFIIGISAVVLLFLAAIFIIYYLNSRNKELVLLQEQQKANEEIYHLMFEQQGKIDSARDEEKNRIAMELHDGILNNIYAVRLNLEFSNRKTDDETIVTRKGYIKELQLVESEIRAVSHNLSRNTIFNQNNDFGSILGSMVTSQKNDFDTQFEAYIDNSIDWEALPGTLKINVYRIIQEALQNINKYSQANQASVEVTYENNNLTIIVTDDGVGFNT
ncbi:MAG: tetratricopeptide repeat protein, partial [Bacteroidota bacterium]